jgi:hypothetical protein
VHDVAGTGALRVIATFGALTLLGCGQATLPMRPGTPLEVTRGYCFVSTTYKQRGEEVNRDDVMTHLAAYKDSGPYVSEGNAFAVGSIVATVVATPAIVVGAMGKQGQIKMDDGVSTGLLVGGIAAGVASWVLCITSDAKYATAAETYNERVNGPETRADDEHAYELPDSSE